MGKAEWHGSVGSPKPDINCIVARVFLHTYADLASTTRGLLYLIEKRLKAQTTSHLLQLGKHICLALPYGHTCHEAHLSRA
jgi:hypothetical protein